MEEAAGDIPSVIEPTANHHSATATNDWLWPKPVIVEQPRSYTAVKRWPTMDI